MGLTVLHVLDHSIPLQSGYSFRTLEIVNEQRRRGLRPVLLTSSKHYGATRDKETVDGHEFHRTRPSSSWLHRTPVLNQAMTVIDTARRLEEVARRERPDLLHAHSPALNGLAALWASRRLDLPVVYEMRASWEDAAVDHGTTREGSLRYRLSRRLESEVLLRADAIATICQGLKRDIVARGIGEDRVAVIPNAVDVADFPPADTPDAGLRAACDLGAGPILGFVGSFYGYEGLDLLLAAMPAILRSFPSAGLLLVGGGPAEPELRQATETLGLSGRVHFAGRVPHADVRRYYSLIDLLAYPRKSMKLTETVTPLKPLEAMALGRPFVASDVGGHREVVPRSLHECLFAAGSPDDLARGATKILSSAGVRARLVADGRRFVETERTWAQSVAGYDAVYELALARHGRKASAISGPAP